MWSVCTKVNPGELDLQKGSRKEFKAMELREETSKGNLVLSSRPGCFVPLLHSKWVSFSDTESRARTYKVAKTVRCGPEQDTSLHDSPSFVCPIAAHSATVYCVAPTHGEDTEENLQWSLLFLTFACPCNAHSTKWELDGMASTFLK